MSIIEWLLRLLRGGRTPVPTPPPPPPPPPPPSPPTRSDAVVAQWAREEMAKVTSRPISANELAQGVAYFQAEPYRSMTEAQVRAAMRQMAQQQAAANGWPPPAGAPSPTPVPTPAPVPVPNPTPTPVPAPAPGGLVTDKLVRPVPTLAKPAKGQSYIDPVFGTRVTRLTDILADSGSRVCKPAYSTIPAWNCDESLLILYVTQGPVVGHALFSGKTYAPIKMLDIQPADIEHFYWSSTDPDILFYPFSYEASGTPVRQLIKYHVASGQKEVIYNFTNAGWNTDFGGDPIYGSYDNQVFGLRARTGSGNASQGDNGYILRLPGTESPRAPNTDAPQISPSGRYALAGSVVADAISFTQVRTRTVTAHEHGSMVRLANGQDVWASVQFDGSKTGTVVAENLDSSEVKVVVGQVTGYPYPPSGTHMSGHCFSVPGRLAVSVTGEVGQDKSTPLCQELLMVDLNTDQVYRVAHHRSYGGNGPNGYWAEPHVNISPSGTRMIFGSDWGGGPTVDAYVVELP